MPSENFKEKHSKRLHDTQVKISKRAKLARQQGLVHADETHRYAKMHPFNCGNSKCVMCGNPRKFWNQETIQEKRGKQDKVQNE